MPALVSAPPCLEVKRAALLDPAALRSRVAGRSYWALLLTDGTIVPEWQCDWPLAPQKGRRALRLYTPAGTVATLDDGRDCTGRCFQLKVAHVTIGRGRGTLAHLIGLIVGPNGECVCAAWDYEQRRLLTFRDNAHAMQYHQIGAICTDHVGLAAP
jgi:hypothetical protein